MDDIFIIQNVVQTGTFTWSKASDKIKGMGRAGKALKYVLETYDISQNRLASVMGIGRSNVHRWVNEIRDPGAETMLQIRNGLQSINPAAAEDFISLYLNASAEDEKPS